MPVVAFEDSGGIPAFLPEKVLASGALLRCAGNGSRDRGNYFRTGTIRFRSGEDGGHHRTQFSFPEYVRDLLRLAVPDLPTISVAVPNYNYAHCLPERLFTIFDQNHPVEEIIVLDDASSDESISVIMKIAEERQRDLSLVINEAEFGFGVCAMDKGRGNGDRRISLDCRSRRLVGTDLPFELVDLDEERSAIAFGFTDSKSIDGDGAHVYASYKPYFATIEPGALSRTEVFDGRDFVTRYLA